MSSSHPRAHKGRVAEHWSRLGQIYHKEIWRSAYLTDPSLKGHAFAVLRIVSITITAFGETRVASRAAALSFSSLLGLGPLVAIAVLVAGFALGKNNPDQVAKTLHSMIKFVVPQLGQYESLSAGPATVNPQLVEIINNIIRASQSGSAGALGGFSLIIIVLLLFKTIEDAFNDIWGVRLGRSLLIRIAFYWTILTLGAVLFFTSVALLGATAYTSIFMDRMPQSLNWALPVLSFTVLGGFLTLCYRIIPNTRVFWRSALIGGIVVASLLMLNNFLAFLYIKRVVLDRSLYGSLAIVPVLMLGLYTLWLSVLIGGLVSYAIQNVHFRNSQAAWSTLTESMRERLSLVVFLTICRRFRDCLPAVSASELSAMLKVPTQLLNECLNRLVQLQLVSTVRTENIETSPEDVYQPARPLSRITLYDFKTLDDNFGEDPIGASLERIDPLLHKYIVACEQLGEQEFFKKNLEQLFLAHPFEEAKPAFTQTERKPLPKA